MRTRDVSIQIDGIIPHSLLAVLQEEYGCRLRLWTLGSETMRSILSAPQYKKELLRMSPADYLRFFRLDNGLTQAGLGQRLGGLPRRTVCDMENGRRPISRAMALRLSRLFGASVARFVG